MIQIFELVFLWHYFYAPRIHVCKKSSRKYIHRVLQSSYKKRQPFQVPEQLSPFDKTLHRPQIDGYLLMQSLSRIVKYQFDVLCVINPWDRRIEDWIRNQYTLWTKLSCASRIQYATSISELHLHPSRIIASISYNPHNSAKEIPLQKRIRNLPKKLPIIKRTSTIRP